LGYDSATQLRGLRQISPGKVVKPTGSESAGGARRSGGQARRADRPRCYQLGVSDLAGDFLSSYDIVPVEVELDLDERATYDESLTIMPDSPPFSSALAVPHASPQTPDLSTRSTLLRAPALSCDVAGPTFDSRRLHNACIKRHVPGERDMSFFENSTASRDGPPCRSQSGRDAGQVPRATGGWNSCAAPQRLMQSCPSHGTSLTGRGVRISGCKPHSTRLPLRKRHRRFLGGPTFE
jgi:hypothetical protein